MNLQNKHKFVVVVAITALVMVLSQQQLHPVNVAITATTTSRKCCYHSNNYAKAQNYLITL